MLNPLLQLLDALKITYTVKCTQSATYYDHYFTYFGPFPKGQYGQVGMAQYGGRLIPHSTFRGNTTAWVQTIRSIRDLGPVNFAFFVTDVSRFADYDKNGVVPAVSLLRIIFFFFVSFGYKCRALRIQIAKPSCLSIDMFCLLIHDYTVACRLGSGHSCFYNDPVVFRSVRMESNARLPEVHDRDSHAGIRGCDAWLRGIYE